jgi:hypothetical protein
VIRRNGIVTKKNSFPNILLFFKIAPPDVDGRAVVLQEMCSVCAVLEKKLHALLARLGGQVAGF